MVKIIRKVWKNKANNQKLVTIPKESDISDGDYVYIYKVEKEDTDKNGTGQPVKQPGVYNAVIGIPSNGLQRF